MNTWDHILKDYETSNTSYPYKSEIKELLSAKREDKFFAAFEKSNLEKSVVHLLDVLFDLRNELNFHRNQNLWYSYKTCILILENIVLIKKMRENDCKNT